MNDIFKDMQAKVGCEYISDLPSYKRKVWQEMKRLNPADYEERQLEEPYSFLKSQITYALRPKITYAGKAVKLHKQILNETITAVRSVNYVPDKIY